MILNPTFKSGMLQRLHDTLHGLLDTRTKKALAITVLYTGAWLAIYDVMPASDSLAVSLAGSREAARQVANRIMEVLFWVTSTTVVLVAVVPAKIRRR